jgi:tRNA A58 N-methylase Trm61
VLIKELSSDPKPKLIRKPLKPASVAETHKGSIKHDDIIGARLNAVVKTSKGSKYTVHEPTLAEYVTLTSRLVAPVRSSGGICIARPGC